MRRLLKFLHTLGAVGLTGAMAAVAIAMIAPPAQVGTAGYVLLMAALAKIAAWIILPSMALTLVAGLLAIGVNPALHDSGWAWTKAATGILIFEGALHVVGPIQEEARRGATALAGSHDVASVAKLFTSERGTLVLLLAVSVVNIALGVWRPRFPRIPL